MSHIKKILIVEDDASTFALLSKILHNYEVKGYPNPLKVGDDFRNYDLFIFDNKMPYMTGIQFLKIVRDAGVFTPCLLISAVKDYEGLNIAYKLGIEDYLLKPFNPNLLLSKIKQIENKIEINKNLEELVGGIRG